jgi:uncharacterized protein YraI
MRIVLIAFMALAWLAASSVPGTAQSTAYTTADVNMREGPGTGYRVIVTIPAGSSVLVHDCLNNRRWCDVSWRDDRGYVFDRYLSGYASGYVPRYSPPRAVPPAIIFEYDYYGDRLYRPRYRYRHQYDGPRKLYRDHGERRKFKKRRDRRKIEKRRDRRKIEKRRDRRKIEKRRDRRKIEKRRDRRNPNRTRKSTPEGS